MFAANVLTVWTEAMKMVFNDDHPDETLHGLRVTIEYPAEAADYPALWIDFTPAGLMKNVGIGHVEYVEDEDTGEIHKVYRWHFGGTITLTLAAMSNLERARIL